MTAVNTVKKSSPMPRTAAMRRPMRRGNLADQQINSDFGEQQLKASLGEVQRLIR